MILYEVVVVYAQIVGERWLQSRVTHRDVERVAVVSDVEQVAHSRLRCVSAVSHAQVAHLAETVAEVERRRYVGHRARRVLEHAQIVLHEVRVLRLQEHTHVEVVFLAYHSEGKLYVVRPVLVFRIAAEPCVKIRLIRIVEPREVFVPPSVLWRQSGEEVLAQIAEVVGVLVALAETVVELIAQLQEGSLPQRLAVSCLQRIVPVARGSDAVAVCLICRVGSGLVEHLIKMHVGERQTVAVAFAVTPFPTHGEVTPLASQTPVVLQRTAELLRLVVSYGRAVVAVHHHAFLVQCRDSVLVERVVHVVVGVGVV